MGPRAEGGRDHGRGLSAQAPARREPRARGCWEPEREPRRSGRSHWRARDKVPVSGGAVSGAPRAACRARGDRLAGASRGRAARGGREAAAAAEEGKAAGPGR